MTFIRKENLSNFTLKKEFCLLKKNLSKRGFYLTLKKYLILFQEIVLPIIIIIIIINTSSFECFFKVREIDADFYK